MVESIAHSPAIPELKKSLTQHFFYARSRAKIYAERERLHFGTAQSALTRFPWPVYDSPLTSYSYTFRDVLAELPDTDRHSIGQWLFERQKTHPRILTCDFMGQGGFHKDDEAGEAVSKELAVTLVDLKNENSDRLKTIDGDVLQGKTWRAMQEFLDQEDVPGFDLIVCRPIGGWSIVFPPLSSGLRHNMAFPLFRRLIDKLHPEGGTLLIRSYDKEVEGALQKITTHSQGLAIDIHDGNTKITRTSPEVSRYR